MLSITGVSGVRSDILTGWITGGGAYAQGQALQAIRFYKAVVQEMGGGADVFSAKVEFTGESLGGGLAGLLAATYRKQAKIYNNMPFEFAAQRLYAHTRRYDHFNPRTGEFLGNYADDPESRQLYFGNSDPLEPDRKGVLAWAVSAEILAALRVLGSQSTPVVALDPGTGFSLSGSGSLGPVDRHDSALLTILLYGKERYDDLGKTDWYAIREQLSLALCDPQIAAAIGIPDSGSQGVASADTKSR